jgi:hypothetical protein
MSTGTTTVGVDTTAKFASLKVTAARIDTVPELILIDGVPVLVVSIRILNY